MTSERGAHCNDRAISPPRLCQSRRPMSRRPTIPAPVVGCSAAPTSIPTAARSKHPPPRHAVVAVVGLGYVGPADGDRAAQRRLPDRRDRHLRHAPGRDPHRQRPSCWSPSSADLARHLAGDGFVLTDRIEALDAADLVLICVPTPVDEQRRPDPRDPARRLRGGRAPRSPGPDAGADLDDLRRRAPASCSSSRCAERGLQVGEDVFVAFAPERIDPGVAEHEQLQTPRVIGGVSETLLPARGRAAAPHLQAPAPRLLARGRRDGEAVREHLPRGQHRARLRDRRSLPDARPGSDRGDRGRGDASRTASWPTTPPPASAGTASRVDPHYLLHPLRERGRPARLAEEALRKLAGRPRHVAWRAHEVLVELGRALAERARARRRRLLQAGRRRHAARRRRSRS